MTDRKNVENARAAWQRLLAQLRSAPVTDAQKLANEIAADLDTLFHLQPAQPQQRGSNVVDLIRWLERQPQRRGSR